MELSTIRKLVVIVITLLLIYQFGTWVASFLNGIWGALSAIFVAGVTFVSSRQARVGASNTGWFLVPTLLFTIIPLIAKVWDFLTGNSSLWDRIFKFTPFFVSFVLPIGILLVVYDELRKQTPGR